MDMIQKDYSQYSLNELYGMYTQSLNDDKDESKLIFEEISNREKSELVIKKDKNKKAPLLFYLLASARNINGNLLVYIGLRVLFTTLILKTGLSNNIEEFMTRFFYLFFTFLIVGSIASYSIKKITGKFNHTVYLKKELITTLLLITLLEIFYFN